MLQACILYDYFIYVPADNIALTTLQASAETACLVSAVLFVQFLHLYKRLDFESKLYL